MDLTGEDTASRVEARQIRLLSLLGAYRQELAALEPRYTKARDRETAVRDTFVAGDFVLVKAGEAIDAWLKAHKSLRAAVEGAQNRPSVSELVSITQEMKTVIN